MCGVGLALDRVTPSIPEAARTEQCEMPACLPALIWIRASAASAAHCDALQTQIRHGGRWICPADQELPIRQDHSKILEEKLQVTPKAQSAGESSWPGQTHFPPCQAKYQHISTAASSSKATPSCRKSSTPNNTTSQTCERLKENIVLTPRLQSFHVVSFASNSTTIGGM